MIALYACVWKGEPRECRDLDTCWLRGDHLFLTEEMSSSVSVSVPYSFRTLRNPTYGVELREVIDTLGITIKPVVCREKSMWREFHYGFYFLDRDIDVVALRLAIPNLWWYDENRFYDAFEIAATLAEMKRSARRRT